MRSALVAWLSAGALVVTLLTGCGGAPAVVETPSNPAAASAPVRPDGAVSLADLGFRNGPSDLWLPERVLIVERVDLGNNVTLLMAQPSGEELADWLREQLPGAGYRITADGAGSLLFSKEPWQGAFTVTGEYSALSLRTDRE